MSGRESSRGGPGTVLVAVTLVGALCSCSGPQYACCRPLSPPARAGIYAQATIELDAATLFKPVPSVPTNVPPFNLAPLIFQEVDVNAAVHRQPAGAVGQIVEPGNDGAPQDEVISTVYAWQEKIRIHGRWHDQLTYAWRYAGRESEPVAGVRLKCQGVRITLDALGQPAIWEALADTSGASVVFVSQSVEVASAIEFQKPLPDRHFCVERSLEEMPHVIVARWIDDGPLPMGPILYLATGTHNILTIGCRCMPAQAKRLVAQEYYNFIDLPGPQIRAAPSPSPLIESGLALEQAYPQVDLEEILRLPGNF